MEASFLTSSPTIDGSFTNSGHTDRYYNLATDLYEYGWGEAFHFCRFAYGEAFKAAVNRHEHFLASSIGIKPGMRVLDVGCGVGGPAREIVKFTGCHVTGLNINNYQISRAKQYAVKEGLTHKLDFVQGDFMVSLSISRETRLSRLELTQTMTELAFPRRLVRCRICNRSHRPRTIAGECLQRNLPCPQARRRLWRL